MIKEYKRFSIRGAYVVYDLGKLYRGVTIAHLQPLVKLFRSYLLYSL